MGRAKSAKDAGQEQEPLPKWAEDEIKSVQFGKPEVIARTGYILDMYEKDSKIDIQVYEPIPDGRSIVEGLDVPRAIKFADLMKGFVYEFSIDVYSGHLSDKLVELLKSKYGLDMKAIYKFELRSLQLLDVESDLASAPEPDDAEED